MGRRTETSRKAESLGKAAQHVKALGSGDTVNDAVGLSFTSKRGDTRVRIHSKSIKRFKEKVRKLTGRNTGRSIHQIIYDLNLYLRGWWNYYSITQSNSIFRSINGWIMRRLRAIL